MKILVTGASGFIGSNLVEQLVNQGHTVIGVDNDPSKKRNLRDIGYKNGFKMLWKDIQNIKEYEHELKDVEKVYHLAASADVSKSFEDTSMDLRNNVIGTHQVLDYMRRNNIKDLIFASSSSIYGVTPITPTPEDVGDIQPISLYGASKLAGEAYISAYSSLYGIKAWMFRFANVIGRHEHRGVIVDFYNKLKKDPSKLRILGNGKQEKSYFAVEDCVRGLLEIPEKGSKSNIQIFNLGNEETMIVDQLAKIVSDEMNVKPRFSYSGGSVGWKGDTPYTILSIEKAERFGWEPKYNCEDAIRRTVRYLKEQE
jgi:UDP-glucose 4-epimerase